MDLLWISVDFRRQAKWRSEKWIWDFGPFGHFYIKVVVECAFELKEVMDKVKDKCVRWSLFCGSFMDFWRFSGQAKWEVQEWLDIYEVF